MTDIVRRSDLTPTGAIVRVDWATKAMLKRMTGDAVIRSASDAAEEALVHQRVEGIYNVGKHIAVNASEFHFNINAVARDNPGLEMGLRDIESTAIQLSQEHLIKYGRRSL